MKSARAGAEGGVRRFRFRLSQLGHTSEGASAMGHSSFSHRHQQLRFSHISRLDAVGLCLPRFGTVSHRRRRLIS